ncbi:MAG: 4a-hydroxytetrahydrobiopterin dehydratase [bacterium]|nr:4a-hydroxytetrahydrobiopterin dehydratase [bacterium]
MASLADRQCVPCRGGVPPMPPEQVELHLRQLRGWEAPGDTQLCKTFHFANFKMALAFVDAVGAMAEEQAHHPDIYLAWGVVRVEIWTHKIDGLTESDFIFAAKCDRIFDAKFAAAASKH